MSTKRKYDDLDNAIYWVSRSVAACLTLTCCDLRLAKEEELRGALTKAEDLEKENLDLMTKLSEKEQECDVRTQERDDLTSSLSRLQEKFETESMGKGTVEVERWPEFFINLSRLPPRVYLTLFYHHGARHITHKNAHATFTIETNYHRTKLNVSYAALQTTLRLMVALHLGTGSRVKPRLTKQRLKNSDRKTATHS